LEMPEKYSRHTRRRTSSDRVEVGDFPGESPTKSEMTIN
jgi:hypothetical protein